MRSYNRLPYWENRNRMKILNDFRKLVTNYFNNLRYANFETIVTPEAEEFRREINKKLKKVHRIITLTGINPVVYSSPPPAIGGLAGNVDLIYNIFNLHQFQLGKREVIDQIDRSIGIYEHDKVKSLIRTFNPFYWIGTAFYYIAALPFIFLGIAGFNRTKIETSFIGKTSKLIIYLAEAYVAIITILDIFKQKGYIDYIKTMFLDVYK